MGDVEVCHAAQRSFVQLRGPKELEVLKQATGVTYQLSPRPVPDILPLEIDAEVGEERPTIVLGVKVGQKAINTTLCPQQRRGPWV